MEVLEGMPLEGAPYYDEKRWVSPLNFSPEVQPPGAAQEVYIHDVTLRDGEQTCGLNWTEQERVDLALALNDFGVRRIEVGMPIMSEEMRSAIKRLIKLNLRAEIVPFCRARPDDIEAAAETGATCAVVEHAVNPYVCKYAYKLDTPALIDRIVSSVNYAKSLGLRTTFMAWDVTRASFAYVKRVYQAVVAQSQPEAIVFTDSFGVASPLAIYQVIRDLKQSFPGIKVEFHVHNEFGMAMGAVMAAASAGVDGIHSSLNGLGERTGNVATEEVVTALELLYNVKTGVDLAKIGPLCELVQGISRVPTAPNKPVTGSRLFWLESGIVIDAKRKLEAAGIQPAMMPYLPELVGRLPLEVVLGGSSGKGSIQYFLEQLGIEVDDDQLGEILTRVKTLGLKERRVLTRDELMSILDDVRKAG